MKDALTRDRITDCRHRFIDVAAAKGWRRAIRTIRAEFPADICAAMETERQTRVVGSEHGQKHPNAEAVAAGKRYQHLFDRAGA